MARANKPRVIEFLSDHPYGAPTWQIAESLGTTTDSLRQTLLRMQGRGELVVAVEAEIRANSVWVVAVKTDTPPIFRAMETLAAMQSTALANLTREAVCA